MSDFRVGDRCYVFGGPKAREDGTNGEVKEVRDTGPYVHVDDGCYWCQSIHREPYIFHRKPDFKVPERPKRKVTKTVEGWANINPEGVGGIYTDKDRADQWSQINRIACVHMVGTYETEE